MKKITPDSIPNRMLYSTVRIIAHNSDSISYGTGFYYDHPSKFEGMGYGVIITNRHVLEGANYIELCVHEKDGNTVGDYFWVETDSWVNHTNKEIDLSLIPISPIENRLRRSSGKHIFRVSGFEDVPIPTLKELKQYNAIEDVVMIGYPDAIWDDKNNYPLIRKGVTASHPGVNFQDKSITVIDIPCFHGSSGSPVFIYNDVSYVENNTINFEERLVFLGVLFAGPIINQRGEIVIEEIPTDKSMVSKTETMLNLGYVIKPIEVKRFVEYFVKAVNS